MRTHRLAGAPAPANTRPTPPAAASGWFLLLTALCFCGVAGFILRLDTGGSAAACSGNAAAVQSGAVAPPQGFSNPAHQVAPVSPFNPDPWRMLAQVWEAQGEELLLVGGSLLGGFALVLAAVHRVTRIPASPLTTGLGRALTLLEGNHRAGTLTPQRALEVARQAAAELEREHEAATRTRTAEYERAIAALHTAHADAVTAIRDEARQAVASATEQARHAGARAEGALARAAHAEQQVQQLSLDLATAHRQVVEASAVTREQAREIDALRQAAGEAGDTLLRWQAAHKALAERYNALTTDHADLQTALKAAQGTAAAMTARCETAEAEVGPLRHEKQSLAEEKDALARSVATLEKELSRLRSVTLKELPLAIPDREGDLVPHMAKIVEFIRGTTVDSGAANGGRTTKPVLSSWRDIRRLFQVLKGVGVRLAVPAHHVPQWAAGRVEDAGSERAVLAAAEGILSAVPALTETALSVHNGEPVTDPDTSEADVTLVQCP